MKTMIRNGIVVPMNRNMDVWPDGYVVFEGTKILEAGPVDGLDAAIIRYGGENGAGSDFQVIDARRAIVMPGMVNTHCHLGMIPFRGLGDDCKDRLRVFLLPMEEQAMDCELAVASSRYAVAELLLGGVTTVLDMYYFEDQVARVMDEMGIRGIAGETVMEEATCDAESPQEAIDRGEAMIRAYRDHPRIKGCLAPHGTTTCSPDTLRRVHDVDRFYNVPFTLHVAEMDYEMIQLRDSLA